MGQTPDKSFWSLLKAIKIGPQRSKEDVSSLNNGQLPVRMSGTNHFTLRDDPHKSDSLTEQIDTGLMGNDNNYPTTKDFSLVVETGSSNRRQDVQNSHLSEGQRPGKIPYMFFNRRHTGRLSSDVQGQQFGSTAGLLLNISGNPAGGLGEAMFIPHESILRPAGMARGSYRTIDDGAQIPGVFVADPTRR